jgi:hypothetical protein
LTLAPFRADAFRGKNGQGAVVLPLAAERVQLSGGTGVRQGLSCV